jgi:hypothetical protein
VTTPVAAPTAVALAVSPYPGGASAVADEALVFGSSGSGIALLGLVARVAKEYDSEDNFCWEGDESGAEFTSAAAYNSNNAVSFTHQSITLLLKPCQMTMHVSSCVLFLTYSTIL